VAKLSTMSTSTSQRAVRGAGKTSTGLGAETPRPVLILIAAFYFSADIAAEALSFAAFISPALQAASASLISPAILLMSVPALFAPASDRGAWTS
jgi:hypothetical protein